METGPRVRAVPDRALFTWAALVALALVFAGFARTYYLRGLFDQPPLPPLLHLHGFVMTVWFVLLVVQVRLVAARRVGLHRRLGVFGALWAALVLAVGIVTAIDAARRGASPGPPPLAFLAVPLGDMAFFAVTVGLALAHRRSPAVHKRLMLLSFLGILPAAFGRVPLVVASGPLAFFGLTNLVVAGCIVADTVRHRRLHPAFGWGFLFLVATEIGRFVLSGTETWMRFARWLTA